MSLVHQRSGQPKNIRNYENKHLLFIVDVSAKLQSQQMSSEVVIELGWVWSVELDFQSEIPWQVIQLFGDLFILVQPFL